MQSVNRSDAGEDHVQGKELPLPVYAKRPNLNRQEISLPDGKVVQASTAHRVVINPIPAALSLRRSPGPPT